MTIDKNEPDEIPADEKDESPNSKEITEKVTKKAKTARNLIKNAEPLNKYNTIWYFPFSELWKGPRPNEWMIE